MRWRTATLALAATAAVCLAGPAHAARWHVGVFVGGPGYYYAPGPYYYAPPPYYYGPPVIVQDEPDVYIERSQMPQQNAQSSAGTWWYCAASKSYYPYVKECSSGWQEVPAAPPAPKR